MDAEILAELQKCLERYWRAMAHPPAEKAPFAVGIAKMEVRIEQLRAATDLDTEKFIIRVQEALRPLYGYHVMSDAEHEMMGECLDRASACFRRGDQPGAVAALSALERLVVQITQNAKQEVFQL